MRNIKKLIMPLILILFCTACASFQDTYKPLYQVKPIIKQEG